MGGCQTCGDKYNFSKILIFIWMLELYDWHHILWIVFLEVTDSLCSFFEKMSAKYSGLSNHSLTACCFFQVKMVLHENSVQLTHNPVIEVLVLEMTIIFHCAAKVLYAYFRFCHAQGSLFNKINQFYCLIKDILK